MNIDWVYYFGKRFKQFKLLIEHTYFYGLRCIHVVVTCLFQALTPLLPTLDPQSEGQNGEAEAAAADWTREDLSTRAKRQGSPLCKNRGCSPNSEAQKQKIRYNDMEIEHQSSDPHDLNNATYIVVLVVYLIK